MYIIIHKYQRWSVNGKTKQKYLKNMPKKTQTNKTNKQTPQKTTKQKGKKNIKIGFVG